jgi:hypothetical protein
MTANVRFETDATVPSGLSGARRPADFYPVASPGDSRAGGAASGPISPLEDATMYCVVEYGENIGTLRNLFNRKKDASSFARRIMNAYGRKYRRIGRDAWFCRVTKEFIRVDKV